LRLACSTWRSPGAPIRWSGRCRELIAVVPRPGGSEPPRSAAASGSRAKEGAGFRYALRRFLSLPCSAGANALVHPGPGCWTPRRFTGQALGCRIGDEAVSRRRWELYWAAVAGQAPGRVRAVAAFVLGGPALRGCAPGVGCGSGLPSPSGPDVRLVRGVLLAGLLGFGRICPGSIAAPSLRRVPNTRPEQRGRGAGTECGSKKRRGSRKLRNEGGTR